MCRFLFMKILFITSPNGDNLEDGILHGLRSLLGADCIDYPKKDVMYRNFAARPANELYGKLFTLWKTLDDIQVDRTDIDIRIKTQYFDWIIFGSFFRSQPFFEYYYRYLDSKKTIILDGEDLNNISTIARRFLYFKRELQPKAIYYYNFKLVPPILYNRIAVPSNVMPIAFSIPKEKINFGVTRNDKQKLFPLHIVDKELLTALKIPVSSDQHLFETESQYYEDLRRSRFGITLKRCGWDCLRHYEIAANGAVICFRDLLQKPLLNAPHGLDSKNSINYSSVEELVNKLEKIGDNEYDELLRNSFDWISQQTTEIRARNMLDRAYRKIGS
jgi:hypothetical protein